MKVQIDGSIEELPKDQCESKWSYEYSIRLLFDAILSTGAVQHIIWEQHSLSVQGPYLITSIERLLEDCNTPEEDFYVYVKLSKEDPAAFWQDFLRGSYGEILENEIEGVPEKAVYDLLNFFKREDLRNILSGSSKITGMVASWDANKNKTVFYRFEDGDY